MKERSSYFFLAVLVVFLGIMSRHIPYVPLCTGDALYAILLYLVMRLFFSGSVRAIAIAALLLCFLIEFLQLYQAPWIVAIRQSLLGRYILGQGFLWGDLMAYTVGIAVCLIAEDYFDHTI